MLLAGHIPFKNLLGTNFKQMLVVVGDFDIIIQVFNSVMDRVISTAQYTKN